MRTRAVLVTAIAFAVALLDGAFKYLAIRFLPLDSQPVSAPIDLALHKNPGISFDIPLPMAFIVPFTIVVIAALLMMARDAWRGNAMRSASAAVIALGALGNLVDRIINGFTTDYLILFATSAINLADILIIVGAVGLLYYTRYNPPVPSRES